jgi:shikimate 5-dehydrogenase/shikimate kinase
VIYLLVGHRGCGKSTFLENIRSKELARCIDLDQEIEQRTGQTISEIFNEGENSFRKIEQEALLKLFTESDCSKPVVIAVGAGYAGPIPKGAQVVWIRRSTDALGRSFLNRPRLDAEVSPHQEYLRRYEERSNRYQKWATIQILLPEGYQGGMEEWLFGQRHSELCYITTVRPEHLDNWSVFKSLGQPREILELRDDWLSPEQMQLVFSDWPRERVLYSHRKRGASLPSDINTDWPLELGPPPFQMHSLSLHERSDSLTQTLERFSKQSRDAQILKLAVEISSFAELLEAHQWWQQSPESRSFLPRSKNGRWQWYRQLFGPTQPLHFVREDDGSAPDQPTLWQTLTACPFSSRFAAILGDPTVHSRTPTEQSGFFAKKNIPVVAVPIGESEFFEGSKVLRSLGLTAAAVTAPLKHLAFEVCDSITDEALHVETVNTLLFHDGKISGHNTDLIALKKLAQEMPAQGVWLWGGGGVKSSVRVAWPSVFEISARQGLNTEPLSAEITSPEMLIWAVPRIREFKYPPSQIRPKLVLDLNYSDDSPGLEWAVRENLPYQSGLRMFKLQAEAQREFWSRIECKEDDLWTAIASAKFSQ